MTYLGLHVLDWGVLGAYFALVIYIGVFLGSKETKNLGDFFVAGGRWGALVSFIFVFASALAGNEAVVVSGASYAGGLSGFWMWGNFLFATPIYFLFSTYYRRARVYNLAEFLEMRYGARVAALYALVAGIICVLFIGMFLLAVGQILGGALEIKVQPCIWSIAIVVAAYVFAGGMMSTLLTDLLQGILCLVILGFLFLPYLWNAAGGFQALRALPHETWNFTGPRMGLMKVIALCLTTVTGGIAAPWIYNWIAVSKDEKAATQCAWAHLWKRVATLFFTLYGILFAILLPTLASPDMAWGVAMKKVLPPGAMGLMIASFFAAAMSSAATYATISAAMFIDYIYRKFVLLGRPRNSFLLAARSWSVMSIVAAASSTHFIVTTMGIKPSPSGESFRFYDLLDWRDGKLSHGAAQSLRYQVSLCMGDEVSQVHSDGRGWSSCTRFSERGLSDLRDRDSARSGVWGSRARAAVVPAHAVAEQDHAVHQREDVSQVDDGV